MATTTTTRSFPAPSTRRQFALRGRSVSLDPRTAAVRPDLADIRLAEQVFAPHYAAAVPATAIRRAPILADRANDAPVLSEILPGETFEVLEIARGAAWGICPVDGCVGFVPVEALGASVTATHMVTAIAARATGRSGAEVLPMGARVAGTPDGDLLHTDAGDLALADLRPLDQPLADPVSVAEALVAVPATPGGRSGAGVDGAGLVFLSLLLAGRAAPRFSTHQANTLGVALADDIPLTRGDLVFFAAHVAMMVDAAHAIHAPPGGTVTVEPLALLVDGDAFGPVMARRRLA